VRPGIDRRVETFVAEVASMDFTEERKVAIKVGVPSNCTSCEY
jgi:hypothetical protein